MEVLLTVSVVQEGGPAANGLQPSSITLESDFGKSIAEAVKITAAQAVNNVYLGSTGAQDPYRTAGGVRHTAEEWATHEAPNGKPFYHNLLTGATQWEKPAALEIQNHSQVRLRYITISLSKYQLF